VAARETPESRSPSTFKTLARAIQRLFKTIPHPEPQTASGQPLDRSASGPPSSPAPAEQTPAPAEQNGSVVPFDAHVVPNLKPVNLHGHEPLIGLPAPAVVPPPVGQRARRSVPQDIKIAVSVRDGGRCRQCGSTHQLHFDHVIPVSRGGANTAANIQLLCGSCNRAKAAKLRLTDRRLSPCTEELAPRRTIEG
jgi:hypothetical protein